MSKAFGTSGNKCGRVTTGFVCKWYINMSRLRDIYFWSTQTGHTDILTILHCADPQTLTMHITPHYFLILTFTFLSLILSFVSAAPGAPLLVSRAQLVKRGCVHHRCRCEPGLPTGTYCGWEINVLEQGERMNDDDPDHSSYYCNTNGTCCNFGPSSSCQGVRRQTAGRPSQSGFSAKE